MCGEDSPAVSKYGTCMYVIHICHCCMLCSTHRWLWVLGTLP